MAGVFDRVGGRVTGWWDAVRETVLDPHPARAGDDRIADAARERAPVIWLLGMTGSGKTSIVRTLTGTTEAEVGNGFRPCTRTARVFDFPTEAPVLRFLDTRGLGEVSYDPTEDLALCERRAHMVLAVVRAAEPVPGAVFDVLKEVRRRHPDWPVVVAQTTLHDAYPGQPHPEPWPFGDGRASSGIGVLDRSLAMQRETLSELRGSGAFRFAPIDFTLPEDDMPPADYGAPSLLAALDASAPDCVTARIREAAGDIAASRAASHVWGYAMAAGGIDLLPVVGAVAAPVVQGKMLHSLGNLFGIAWTSRTLAEFAGSLGTGVLVRYGVVFLAREAGKLIPWYGQVFGAAAAGAASFATTFALGRAAILYLKAAQGGGKADAAVIAAEFARALAEAAGKAQAARWFGRRSGDGA